MHTGGLDLFDRNACVDMREENIARRGGSLLHEDRGNGLCLWLITGSLR